MGTVSENKKYTTLLSTARYLFWKHGFRKVSVEEVCKKANVSKMTFYRFFKDKKALARVVIDREMENGIRRFEEILTDETTTVYEKMMQLLMLKKEGISQISREFLEDFYSNPDLGLKEHLEFKTMQATQHLVGIIRNAQVKGWLRKDFKPEILLIFSSKVAEMIREPGFSGMFATPEEMIMELTGLIVFGIAPPSQQDMVP